MRRECPRHRLQRKPLVSDPGMHDGPCVSHVPWCMSGSLTRDGGESVPGIAGACAPAILRIWQEAHGTAREPQGIFNWRVYHAVHDAENFMLNGPQTTVRCSWGCHRYSIQRAALIRNQYEHALYMPQLAHVLHQFIRLPVCWLHGWNDSLLTEAKWWSQRQCCPHRYIWGY